MTLFKTSLWTGISTLIKAIAAYVTWKTIAIYTGPAGLAIIEQFQNFIQVARSLSCSLNQAIVKYIAEYKNDEDKKSRILSSALIFYLTVSFLVAIILLYFSAEISSEVFQSLVYKKPIILLGLSIILFSLNNLLVSVLNGELEIKKLVSSGIANTLLIFIITIYLVINYGLQGGLIGFILNQSIILLFTLYLVIKCQWFKFHSYIRGIDLESLHKLAKFALITFTTVVIAPASLIIVRRYVAHTLTWEDAGYWQGIMKLSTGYLILMNLVLSAYYLPKFSELQTISELKKEIIDCYKFIFPFVLFAMVFIFLLKKQIVLILYSPEFIPMLVLFKYQMIGDIARMGAWLLANVLIAKAAVKTLVITEIVFALSYVFFTVIFIHYFGLIGAAIAFTVNYLLYWICISFFTARYLRNGEFQTSI